MTRWVALLRGVNVGGGNRLPMADLRSSVTALGYHHVTSYIQSGNLVFDSDDGEETVVARLGSVLAERHGLTVPVIVRSGDALAAALDRHPFVSTRIESKFLHVAFLDRRPTSTHRPDADRWAPDRWALDGRELFLAYPDGSGRSKMTIEQFERPWGVTATARNLNTVAKLAELAGAVT